MPTGAVRMQSGGGGRDNGERREAAFASGLLDPTDFHRCRVRLLRSSRKGEQLCSARAEPPIHSAREGRRTGGKLLDHIDHLGSLRRRKPDECLQKPQTLDRFAGRISKLLAHFGNRYAIFHLAPFKPQYLIKSRFVRLKVCQGATAPARRSDILSQRDPIR
jgi:hypothetical protein